MTDLRSSLHGLWLPLVTPFCNGELDEASLRRLVRHYAALPVNGLVLAATTGESLTLEREETERSACPAATPAHCWIRWTKRRRGRSTAI